MVLDNECSGMSSMSGIAKLWAGRVFGTNTGNLFIEFEQTAPRLSGTLRFLDSVQGIAVYRVEGTCDDRLVLTGHRVQGGDPENEGELAIEGRLTSEGFLRGMWKSTIGTGGTFELRPHDVALSNSPHNLGDVAVPKAGQVADTTESDLRPVAEPQIFQFRRDIFPSKIVLSAEDLSELSQLVSEANERAKKIEYANLNLEGFDSPEHALKRVNEFMPVEYNYRAKSGDVFIGLGIPKTHDHSFPEELQSFFVSNASYAQRTIKLSPLNSVDIFLGFKKPSLKIDFQTMPSNPTENSSVINVYGRDEDWVISTANRINEFFRRKRALRPIIHESGAYDYFLFMLFIPFIIWLIYKYPGDTFSNWINVQSTFFNIIFGFYVFLFSFLLGRFLFQYFRWLFPPIEYYKKSLVGAYAHRVVAGAVFSAVLLGAAYDIIKSVVISLF